MAGVQFQTSELIFSLKTYNDETSDRKVAGITAIQEIITICYDPQEGPDGTYCVYNHDRSDECNGISADRDYAIFLYLMKRLSVTHRTEMRKRKQKQTENAQMSFTENPLAHIANRSNHGEEYD